MVAVKKQKQPKTATKKGKKKQVKDSIQESIVLKMAEEDQADSLTVPPPEYHPDDWDEERPAKKTTTSGKKAATKQVNFFLRQMAVLLGSGVPLMKALKILTNRMRHAKLRMAIMDVMKDVETGSQFWAALAKHPRFFNMMMVNVVRSGEESGSLVSAMNYLANYRDREEEMVRSVEKAITYPLFLLMMAIGLVIVLVTAVIPIFAKQFAAANVPLPWPTKLVLGASNALTNFWIVAVLLGVAGYIAYKKIDWSKGFGSLRDRLILRMPVFGRILTHIYTVQFATMMSLLLKSGLPLMRTLDLVRATLVNKQFRKAFAYVKANVERGRTLFESLSDVNVFPPVVLDMVAVGEEAGSLPEVLEQVATSYQKEVEHDTAIIGTLLEPVLIVGLGLVIGFIAFSIFLPYFNMVNFIA